MEFVSSDPQVVVNGGASAPPMTDLEQIIKESKENLAAAEAEPVKRKRGRPRKSESVPQNTAPQTTPEPAAPSAMVPILKYVVRAPFQVAAARTGFEKFDLEDSESTELATLADAVLSQYLPQLSGDKAAIITFVAALGAVGFSKYMLYQEHVSKEPKKEETNAQSENVTIHSDNVVQSAPFASPDMIKM